MNIFGKSVYAPSLITVPVLVTVGELDRDTPVHMAQTLFPLLTGAPRRRLSVLIVDPHDPDGAPSDAVVPQRTAIP